MSGVRGEHTAAQSCMGEQADGTSGLPPSAAPPGIAQFYADQRAKPGIFVRTLRKAQTKSFRAEDVEEALRRLKETDPTLSRTLALAGTGALPDAVEQWINRVALKCFQELAPDAISNLAPGAGETLGTILRALRADLTSKDKQTRTRAENLLRLALIWLVSRRDLDPIDALRTLADNGPAAKGKEPKSFRRSAQRLLKRAKPAHRRDLVLVAELHRDALAAASVDRQEALRGQAQVRERVEELEQRLEARQAECEQLEQRIGEIGSDLAAAKDAMRQERELRTLDAEEAQGRLRQMLSGRLDPLLADARDALDFEPPRIDAAKQSIDLARRKIGEEAKNTDG